MGFQINYGGFAFAVPADVVDHYIRLADGDALKVLLFALRHAQENITAESAAEYLRISPEKAAESLTFWEQADILRQNGAQTGTNFAFAAPAPQEVTPAPAVKHESPVGSQKSSKEVRLDPSEIAETVENSEELTGLFTLAEKHLARPLNHMEQRSLIWMNQYLNIPSEIILMLIRYAVDNEIYSVSYAESIAIRWQSAGILTLEAAEEELKRMTRDHSFTNEIRRMFELKRTPTPKQKSFIDRWQNAGYPLDLIQYAYETTLDNKNDLSFPYLDKILQEWEKAGAKTREDAEKLQAQPRPTQSKRTSKSKSQPPISQEELDEMNEYLSLANRFKEDSTNE